MVGPLPYCGAAPVPGELATRFNWDPVLLVVLFALAAGQLLILRNSRQRRYSIWGWAFAAGAFVSPLCALSVALFSARIFQHMLLVLVAAPLLASALPAPMRGGSRVRLWGAATFFFIALWFWHMPAPYQATFLSTPVYWAMHISLFGSAILLWRELLHGSREHLVDALVVGALSSMQMGLLGAVLTMASRPLFLWHMTTTQVWGLSPLEDQQLGGVFMWVPGIVLFLWAGVRTLERLRAAVPAVHSR